MLRKKLRKTIPTLDYLIVLGAHVDGERLTKALYERVRKALEYLETHPETKAVLSGGKGKGEAISVAEAMRRYLIRKGISPERLLLEEKSVNTKENLEFSLSVIGDKHKKIGVVTNHYHVFRGVMIGKKAGCTRIYGIGSRYVSWRLIWYIPREILAVCKDRLKGNL